MDRHLIVPFRAFEDPSGAQRRRVVVVFGFSQCLVYDADSDSDSDANT